MTKVKWTDVETIQQLLDIHQTRRDVIRAMGYSPYNYKATSQLNEIIRDHELNANFVKRQMPDRYKILPDVINECFSYSDAIRACGLSDVGSNHTTIKKYIKQLKLDVSHFKKASIGPSNKIPTDDLFVKNSVVARSTVRKRTIKEQLVPYCCANCDNNGTWDGKELTLQLEHKNGNNTDNRLENLEFLCPNCHSQTATWGAKDRNNKVVAKPAQRKFVEHQKKQHKQRLEFDKAFQQLKDSVVNSGIDFQTYGWVKKVAKVLNCEPQYVSRWMRQHLPDLYEQCYKRKSRLIDR